MVGRLLAPADVASGVGVGDVEYPGFPAAGAGAAGADPAVRMAFFALLHDQPLNVPIAAFARDDASNQAKATFVDMVFEKPFKKSRIEINDVYMNETGQQSVGQSTDRKRSAQAQESA